jgi:hypothetical protein
MLVSFLYMLVLMVPVPMLNVQYTLCSVGYTCVWSHGRGYFKVSLELLKQRQQMTCLKGHSFEAVATGLIR